MKPQPSSLRKQLWLYMFSRILSGIELTFFTLSMHEEPSSWLQRDCTCMGIIAQIRQKRLHDHQKTYILWAEPLNMNRLQIGLVYA